jgi:hypothetical protein
MNILAIITACGEKVDLLAFHNIAWELILIETLKVSLTASVLCYLPNKKLFKKYLHDLKTTVKPVDLVQRVWSFFYRGAPINIVNFVQ